MRPGQSNKRSRGRGRKGPSPLSRSYESNGPDVKIRGTAQHIADKYINLARDAQSSSDTVLAEAYLQHAEHFYRIVAAAQQQMNQVVNVKRADDPIETDDGDERGDDFDPSDPNAPQPEAGANGEGGRSQNRDDDGDGERRNRRNRGRQRRGRDDRDQAAQGADRGERGERSEHSDQQPAQMQAEGQSESSSEANVEGSNGEEAPKRAPRQRRARVDVSDRHESGDTAAAAESAPAEAPAEPPRPVTLGDDVAPVQAAADEPS